jgi:hypothetical protein
MLLGDCTNIFVDVGADRGDSMLAWMNVSEVGQPSAHSMDLSARFSRVAPPNVRRSFCIEAFEANPHFNTALASVAAQLRLSTPASYINVHNATAFALESGMATLGVDALRHDGSSLI